MSLAAAWVCLVSRGPAYLPASLADVPGSAPSPTGDMPQTLGEILAFYAAAEA